MFGTVLTVAYTALLVYVLQRASSVPVLAHHLSRKRLIAIGAVLWIVFLLGRFLGHGGTGVVALILELAGMTLLGWVFLSSTALFVVDLATVFGRVMSKRAPTLRGCGMAAGTILSVVAVIQASRAPAVVSYEVTLPNLSSKLDGTTLVALSDAHLGTHLGGDWFSARIGEIRSLKPDIVVFLGDILEGHGDGPREIPALGRLSPPLGKWFVEGNHESHRDSEESTEILVKAGFHRLANQWVEPAPGLILAGVTDLTRHRRKNLAGDPLGSALANRPGGATVLLSHTPWQADRAARAGVELMLSGHTHGGQIWPFSYLVRIAYPLLAGRYDVEGIPVIVTRGVGTWGPPMRLWHRGEILVVKLRAPQPTLDESVL